MKTLRTVHAPLASVAVLALFVANVPTTFANEPAANFVARLFIDVCVPNMGNSEKVRMWASQRQLKEVSAPAALEVFVGPGPNGDAWAVPSQYGSFALSIRGTTEACAAWAHLADPIEVEGLFRQIMEGVKRPGLDVGVESDTTVATAFGAAHSLVYHVWPTSGNVGFAFTLLTAERPGAPFQASLQVAKATR
jgi:hypothetical protein